MKTVATLIVTALVLAVCPAQPAVPPQAASGPFPGNNWMNFMMYRSLFDMNMLPAMLLSGQVSGAGGSPFGSGFLPYFWMGHMF